MTNRMTTIIRHEGVKDSGSYEVKFSDGRPPKFFKWDDDPSQRVRSGVLTALTMVNYLTQDGSALPHRCRSCGRTV